MERTEYCQTKKLEISYNNWKILTGKFVSVNRLGQRYVKTVWATAVFERLKSSRQNTLVWIKNNLIWRDMALNEGTWQKVAQMN